MDDHSPSLMAIDAPVQNMGTVSAQLIRRLVWRRRFVADARGAVHFALTEHEPNAR